MKAEELKRYKEIAQNAFYEHRNERGWGVPQSVQFQARLHSDERYFRVWYSFYNKEGHEFNNVVDLLVADRHPSIIEVHVKLNAENLARQCLLTYLTVYVCDLGLALPVHGKAFA